MVSFIPAALRRKATQATKEGLDEARKLEEGHFKHGEGSGNLSNDKVELNKPKTAQEESSAPNEEKKENATAKGKEKLGSDQQKGYWRPNRKQLAYGGTAAALLV